MSDNRARYPIAVMCRILGVSLSIYYAWVKRPACARALMDTASTVEIRAAHAASKGTYGHHVCSKGRPPDFTASSDGAR